jgi:hypothetical protein
MRALTVTLLFILSFPSLFAQNSPRTNNTHYSELSCEDKLEAVSLLDSLIYLIDIREFKGDLSKKLTAARQLVKGMYNGDEEFIETLKQRYGITDTLKYKTLERKIDKLDSTLQKDTSNKKKQEELNSSLQFQLAKIDIRSIVYQELYPLLGITENDCNGCSTCEFCTLLDRVTHTETITWLELMMTKRIDSIEYRIPDKQGRLVADSPYILKKQLKCVNKRMEDIMSREFSMYRFTETSKKVLKSINLEHTNDVFSLYNDDRDFTGGFRFEFTTDLLKMRLLPFKANGRDWYSYQSLFIGGEGYTPYLRDTTIFKTPTSVDSTDRPYASFRYFGRAKYRISRHGRARIFTQFKLGSIGSTTPGNIQSVIHRDLTVSSFKPQGWDAQIAAGGRLAFSAEGTFEWLFVGRNGILWKTKKQGRFGSLNVSPLIEMKIGHDITSGSVGINLSNRNFKETGGLNSLLYSPYSIGGWLSNIIVNYRLQYRYVVHNSMLEGYGIVDHDVDENPTSPADPYVLVGSQIKRNILLQEFIFSYRFRYCSLILKQTVMSPEYDLPVNSRIYPFTPGGQPGKHNTHPWNHYGTIGFVFMVQ